MNHLELLLGILQEPLSLLICKCQKNHNDACKMQEGLEDGFTRRPGSRIGCSLLTLSGSTCSLISWIWSSTVLNCCCASCRSRRASWYPLLFVSWAVRSCWIWFSIWRTSSSRSATVVSASSALSATSLATCCRRRKKWQEQCLLINYKSLCHIFVQLVQYSDGSK